MADSAAHLVDRVLPRVPIRQWVLSLPFGLRYRLAHDRELTADVVRVFEIDVLQCPRCRAGPMRILVAIHPPATTEAILKSLGLPTRAPPITPAGPVSEDWSLAEPSAWHYRGNCTDLPAA
jgi:hypothetical protein